MGVQDMHSFKHAVSTLLKRDASLMQGLRKLSGAAEKDQCSVQYLPQVSALRFRQVTW